MANEKQMTEDDQQQWVREQYQVATKYLAEQGLVTNSVAVEDSRYLIPFLAIWKLKILDGKSFWVICGDLPTDHSNASVAPNAREALSHFSYKWQIQAENLLKSADKEQHKFAQLLIGRAEGLYGLHQKDDLW